MKYIDYIIKRHLFRLSMKLVNFFDSPHAGAYFTIIGVVGFVFFMGIAIGTKL